MDAIKIKVEYFEQNRSLCITNESDQELEIHLVPKPPKRKVLCMMVISPNRMYAAEMDKGFKVSDLFFRFV